MPNNNNTNKKIELSSRGLRVFLWVLLVTLSSTSSLTTEAQESYSIRPSTDRCVALRQGQTCYKTITLHWQAPQSGNYCLVEQGSNSIVQCVRNQMGGDIKIKFGSSVDQNYVLRRENESTDLASATVKVSWVYEPKKDKPSNWRLF